jgi:hypothetical protein
MHLPIRLFLPACLSCCAQGAPVELMQDPLLCINTCDMLICLSCLPACLPACSVYTQGAPVELMQDPLHYPHGTKWMAPGPMGQVHPLPDDKNIRLEMARVAKNHAHIFNMYNFDWDPEPGTVDYMINQRIKRGAELQGKRLLRMAGNLDAAEAAADGPQPGLLLAELDAAAEAAAAGASSSSSSQQQQRQGGGLPFGSITASSGAAGGLWMAGPLASCSLSVGVGRASKAVLGTLARAAKRAPTIDSGRARLSRPAARRSSSSSSRQQ